MNQHFTFCSWSFATLCSMQFSLNFDGCSKGTMPWGCSCLTIFGTHSGLKSRDRSHWEIKRDQYIGPSKNTRRIIQPSGGKPGSSMLFSCWSGCSVVCSNSMLRHEIYFLYIPRFILSHVDFSLPPRKTDFLLIHFQVSANLYSIL